MITKAQCVRWIAALEGGKYKQGRWRLRDGDRYCSLGVLADTIVGDGDGQARWQLAHPGEIGENWNLVISDEIVRTTSLPDAWLDDGLVLVQSHLIEMNDRAGLGDGLVLVQSHLIEMNDRARLGDDGLVVVQTHLIEMNDRAGADFKMIAAWIKDKILPVLEN
jgi:hypothetical protein